MNICGSIKLSQNGHGPTTTKSKMFEPKKLLPKKVSTKIASRSFLDPSETIEIIGPISVKTVHEEVVCGNGFISTVHYAFAQEKSIIFSPSQIWTLILQAVAIHVKENAEELRSVFVDHDGKKVIRVEMDHLGPLYSDNTASDWMKAFPVFARKLQNSVKDEDLATLMNTEYESSNEIDKVCFTIAMMDTMQHYFEYRCRTMCGIREVHLSGSSAEWELLRSRAEKLCAKLALDWWSCELLPVLDQFVLLASGDNQNVSFWEHMYRDLSATGSGEEYSSFGWINVFFPYIGKPGSSFKRRCLNKEKEVVKDKTVLQMQEKLQSEEFWNGRSYGYFVSEQIAYGDYPSGISKCPFIWECYADLHDMRFCGGFLTNVGFVEYEKEQVCTPAQGWAVICHQANIKEENEAKRQKL